MRRHGAREMGKSREIVQRCGNFCRATKPVARIPGDPVRIGGAGAYHAGDLLGQGAPEGGRRVGVVEMVERRLAARHRLCGGKAGLVGGIVLRQQQIGFGQVLQMDKGPGTLHPGRADLRGRGAGSRHRAPSSRHAARLRPPPPRRRVGLSGSAPTPTITARRGAKDTRACVAQHRGSSPAPRRARPASRTACPNSADRSGNTSRKRPDTRRVTSRRGRSRSVIGSTSMPDTRSLTRRPRPGARR